MEPIPEEKGIMVMGYDRIPMRDFLMTLEKALGIVNLACQQVGISRATYYNWRDRDEWFKEASEKIIRDAKPVIDDIAKHGLVKHIVQGNVPSIIFYLKTRHPEFRDSMTPEQRASLEGIARGDNMPSLIETIKAINTVLDDEDFVEEWQEKPDESKTIG